MKSTILILTILFCSSLAFSIPFLSKSKSPLVPVQELDLAKYGGLWYEVARLPYLFELECYCTTAEYSLNSDGTVGVHNLCNWGSATGKATSIQGVANAEDPVSGTVTTGRLNVQFFGFVNGPYYVIDIDDKYQRALVGSPDRRTLWILARTPTIDKKAYDELVQKAVENEFNVANFVKVYQGEDCGRDL